MAEVIALIIPALLATGLAPVPANVTNSVAVVPGYLASVAGSRTDLVDLSNEGRRRQLLALARAYLAIAGKERETAKALIDKHGLGDAFASDFDALRQTFERELTREQRLAQTWGERIDDLHGSERRQSVLAHVLAQGSINKSAYAEVAAVSLATASKHLGLLAERGLLVQVGKGPKTRYLLAP